MCVSLCVTVVPFARVVIFKDRAHKTLRHGFGQDCGLPVNCLPTSILPVSDSDVCVYWMNILYTQWVDCGEVQGSEQEAPVHGRLPRAGHMGAPDFSE